MFLLLFLYKNKKQTILNKNKKDIYTNNDINYNYDFNKPRVQTINVSWCSVCIHYGMNEPASGKQNLHLNYHPGNSYTLTDFCCSSTFTVDLTLRSLDVERTKK